MIIATWNVNSVRARSDRIAAWLDRQRPDVVLVQETKCTPERFPSVFTDAGYDVAAAGAGGYNGVAVASRIGLDDVVVGFGEHGHDRLRARACAEGWKAEWVGEPRIIAATCAGVRVVSVYVPNGRELDHPHWHYKLAWLDELEILLGSLRDRPALVAGDFNVAPADVDVWSPRAWVGRTHVSVPERDRVAALTARGWTDVWRSRTDAPGFTWWNYRAGGFTKGHGLRIDLALASAVTGTLVRDVTVDIDERGRDRPSDHAPLLVTLGS